MGVLVGSVWELLVGVGVSLHSCPKGGALGVFGRPC